MMHPCLIVSWVILDEPVWLMALPVVLVPLVFLFRGRRRGMVLPIASCLLQCSSVLLMVLAASQPIVPLGMTARRDYLLFIDNSASVRGQDWLIKQVSFPEGVKYQRYYFADGLGREPVERESATRIAPVLEMISSSSSGKSAGAIIVTDGLFTDTDWDGLASSVGKLGVKVFIVPLDSPPPDARVVSIRARRTTGGKVVVSVVVAANSAVKRTIRITRMRPACNPSGKDGEIIYKQMLSLLPGSAMSVSVVDSAPLDTATEYRVNLEGDEVITENNFASAIVLPERRRIASVGVNESIKSILSRVEFPVSYLSFTDLPENVEGLMDFSSLLIVDSSGAALSGRSRRAVSEYVRAGGGLVLIGTGPHEKPGDLHDPLNKILPLVANPFERKPLRLVVLLDKSGSMSQPAAYRAGRAVQVKFDLAAQAVLALKDYLTWRDSLAVIVFADEPDVIYDSGGNPADFSSLARALKRVTPAGSTNVTPALKVALSGAIPPGKELMVLVVSDLRTERFDPHQWADLFKRARAKLAVVAVRKKDTSMSPAGGGLTRSFPLKDLARLTGSAYLERDRLEGLAEIFGKLVLRARGKVIRHRKLAVDIVGALFGAGISTLPDIDAYIRSAVKRQADLCVRTSSGEPIVASTRVGLGKTVCISLPLSPMENSAWLRSSAVARMLAAAVRWSMPQPNDPRFDVDVSRRGKVMSITVTAQPACKSSGKSEGEFLDGLKLTCTVSACKSSGKSDGTSGVGRQVQLEQACLHIFRQVGPGKYQSLVDFPADLSAIVAVRDDETGKILWRGSSAVQYRQEYRRIGADEGSLRRLARLTGGQIVSASRLGEVLEQSYREKLTPIWSVLVSAAIFLMLVDWVFTRLSVPFRRQKSFQG